MKTPTCENLYTSCASNCYPNCIDCKQNHVIFGSANFIAIYDLNVQQVISVSTHHKDLINSVRFIDENGKNVISSSVDKTNIIWFLNNGVLKVKHVLRGHKDSVIISDSRILENEGVESTFLSVSSSNDKMLCLWLNDQIIHSKNFDYFIFDVKIFQKLIIPGLILLTAGSNDATQIYKFDINTKNLEQLFILKGHTDWVKSIDLTSATDKLMLASASQDYFVRVYETKPFSSGDFNSELQHTLEVKDQGETKKFSIRLETVLAGHEGLVTCVKWINFQNRLHLLTCSMDNMVILWEEMDSQQDSLWNIKIRFGEVGGSSLGFLACSFIPNYDLVVAQSYNGAIHLWKKSEDDLWVSCPSITGHFMEISDLVWEPEGRYFLTCSLDQTTRLHSQWNRGNKSSWHEIARPQIHGYDIKCLSMAGSLKFVSGADEKVIRIFEATNYFLKSLSKISSIDVDLKGDELPECAILPPLGLSNSSIYDTSEMEEEFKPKITEIPPSEEVLLQNTLWSESKKLYGHGYEIFSTAINHQFTLLASACKASKDQHAFIIVWDLKTYEKIAELHSHNLTVTQIRFSPNDFYILSVSRDRTWALFETSRFQRIAYTDKTSNIHSRIIWDCAWTPDSKYFFTASRDKSVISWDVENLNSEIKSKEDRVVTTFEHAITSIDVHKKFIQDDCFLLCVGLEDGNFLLYYWSVSNPWLKLYNFESFRHSYQITRLRFSPKIDVEDSKKVVYFATCSSDRSAKLFKLTFYYKEVSNLLETTMRLSPRALIRFQMPKQGKPMIWPYTLAAKWSQWNIAYEWKMSWPFRYTIYGMIAVFPFVWYIDGLVNSPSAKATYKRMQQLEHEKEHEAHRWADISGRYANR